MIWKTANVALACCLTLSGCAFNVVHVEQVPAVLDPTASCAAPFHLAENLSVRPSGGYERTLKKQTRWYCVGQIPQGYVYQTRDQVLTIEASHVYEARLVVSSGRLVGFYLQVEHTFSPLDPAVTLPVN